MQCLSPTVEPNVRVHEIRLWITCVSKKFSSKIPAPLPIVWQIETDTIQSPVAIEAETFQEPGNTSILNRELTILSRSRWPLKSPYPSPAFYWAILDSGQIAHGHAERLGKHRCQTSSHPPCGTLESTRELSKTDKQTNTHIAYQWNQNGWGGRGGLVFS